LRNLRISRALFLRDVWLVCLLFLMILGLPGTSFGLVSDGSDGPFHPTGDVTLDLPPDGIFNFTTITIDEGITVRFNRNAANTPVYFLATGEVIINGIIDISAHLYDYALGSKIGGPGGGDGGEKGVGREDGTDGFGPSPGIGGPAFSAGGGGGMATEGLVAVRHTGPDPASGGSAIPFPEPLTGGSGGGGGGGWTCFGVPLEGGNGGGAGGAILISTPGDMTIGGRIMANGAWGGCSFANAFGHGGPGGGGSGGVIVLEANSISLEANSILEAKGGPGGGISTMPIWHPDFSSGANGGMGYVRITANEFNLHLAVFAAAFGSVYPDLNYNPVCDFDDDGDVDGSDLAVFASEFGRTDCPH